MPGDHSFRTSPDGGSGSFAGDDAPGGTPGSRRRTGQRLSLRGQALACLSRREYSRQELRRKLLQPPRRPSTPGDGGADTDPPFSDAEVDALLDWLAAKGYLSDERFVESRLHARAGRHGSLRIQQELARHGVTMTSEQAAALRESEARRAHDLWARKFGEVAREPRERARQARFLAARGFPADVVRRIVGGEDDF